MRMLVCSTFVLVCGAVQRRNPKKEQIEESERKEKERTSKYETTETERQSRKTQKEGEKEKDHISQPITV